MLLALLLVLSLFSEILSLESSSITIQYQVMEEQPSGTRVGRLLDDLRKRDEGGPLEDFQVVEQRKALPFSVSTQDGLVSIQGHLDREELCLGSDLCEVAFSVFYRKRGVVNCIWVRVQVMDLNDHSPSFSGAVQEVEISETAGIGKRIPLDRAEDPDAGPNSLQNYSLSANQYFALAVTIGPDGAKQAELDIIKVLDREVHASFNLTLVAWDRGTPPRSGSILVQVHIQDSNDNSPSFVDSSPMVELPEDTTVGTTIIQLTAIDPDQGANGEVEYSLSKHSDRGVERLFYINPQTGAVVIRAPLDYEIKRSYCVVVQAIDHGPNAIPSHCKLHVKLIDVNDNAPRINIPMTDSPFVTVSEGAHINTFVAVLIVNDADSGRNGNVTLQIEEGSSPFSLQQIHHTTYKIVTDASLDREKVMKYSITLLAQDYGVPPLSCVEKLLVIVEDVNDNAPVFFSAIYKASFKENNYAGHHALTVEAHDQDLEFNGRFSYTVIQETPFFSIHPKTGAIHVLEPLDYEECHEYSFIVAAVDYGLPPLTGTTMVQINIEDVNDNHPVIREPKPRMGVASLTVPVSSYRGEIVIELEEGSSMMPFDHSVREGVGFLTSTIKAEDADSGLNGEFHFLITDGNPTELFWLDQTTGQLFVNTTNATKLIGKTFNMDISVTDMGKPSLSTKATLEVTFINLRDHLKNSSPGNHGHLSFTMMMALCLGITCLLLLLVIATVTTFCRTEKRDNWAYNCRQAESSYTCHPRRPQKNIRKSDIQLIPVIRGQKEEIPNSEAQPLTLPPAHYDPQLEGHYDFRTSVMDSPSLNVSHHCRSLRKPGTIKLDGTLTPATSYRTLHKSRNPSSSSSVSHSSTLKLQNPCEGRENVETTGSAAQTMLRRPKTSEGQGTHDTEHQQILQNLVRLSMEAFRDSIELSSASPKVQQISQLLSLLHQGQLQPRTNFRGNKYSHRNRYGGQDCPDWQSTKDSGRGESEAGDVDWEAGRDSLIDPQLEDGLNNLLSNTDDVFSEVSNLDWMARLSLPVTKDYHENVFVPTGPPSPGREPPDSASSFSTFGKTPNQDLPLGNALLSEVSTLFQMLMTQKADAHPGPQPDILYRLSAACRRSLAGGEAERRSGMALPQQL
ncbi:protocadherin-12 [Pholidichthys leucotaenia]